MRSRFAFGVLAVAITVALTSYLSTRVDASTGPIPLNCNRACLEGVVNDYLTALVARDPKRLPPPGIDRHSGRLLQQRPEE